MAKQIHAFADANVVVDLLSRRAPFHTDALKLFSAVEAGGIKVSVSSLTVSVAHYILKKVFQEASVRNDLHDFLRIIDIIPVTGAILKEALISPFTDFEDAVQYECARSIPDISFIVTRDPKHFSRSAIPVVSPLIFNAQNLR